MNNEYWHKIIKIELLDDYKINLIFNDSTNYKFDLNKYFHEGSVFLKIKNKQLFNQVRISNDGRALVFPNEIDFCADSLWLKAHPETISPY
jgi:hypothetical protein